MTRIFDLSKPHARAIRSPMGGGWIIPLTEEGAQALRDFFDGRESYIPPIDETGWSVEPNESADLAEHLQANNLAWEVG